MAFKKLFAAIIFCALGQTMLVGCGVPGNSHDDEFLVGDKLRTFTNLKASTGSSSESIAMFDETLKKIHQFDTTNMTKVRTLKVEYPNDKHFVLYDPNGNYIIDLTQKGITIFDRHNKPNVDPIRMPSQPKSAAFSPEQGLLIVYDDLMNVGFIKLNAKGIVLDSLMLGSLVGSDSIAAGDLLENGILALSLSDGSLAQVNVADTLDQNQWVFTKAATAFSSISWVAAVHGQPQKVLIKYTSGVALMNLTTGATIQKRDLDSHEEFRKLSKAVDAHAVVADDKNFTLIYTDGTALKTRKLYNQSYYIMNSQLDLSKDSWFFVGGSESYAYDIWDGDINVVKKNRKLYRFGVSSMLAQEAIALPNNTQVLMAQDYFFSLYPSELGYAYKQDYLTQKKRVMKGFNIDQFD